MEHVRHPLGLLRKESGPVITVICANRSCHTRFDYQSEGSDELLCLHLTQSAAYLRVNTGSILFVVYEIGTNESVSHNHLLKTLLILF